MKRKSFFHRRPVHHPLQDPSYATLWRRGREQPARAGFLSERMRRLPFPTSISRLCTFQAVVLMTGCFAPFHHGHLSAARAFRKQWATRLRIQPQRIACVFAFCHDAYVSTKTPSWPIALRLAAFGRIRLPYCFAWEYESNAEGPLNFTTVIQAFRASHPNLLHAFLFGVDNSTFLDVFTRNEWTGCAARTESPLRQRNRPRHLTIKTTHRFQSSTLIRQHEHFFLA
jgi:nicotinic acid mononucleotide adenylyltransferase